MKIPAEVQGRYDAEVRAVMVASHASAVLLVVVGGNRGHGFSIAVRDAELSPSEALAEVPTLLRAIADGIDAERQLEQN